MRYLLFLFIACFCFNGAQAQYSDSLHYYWGVSSSGTYNRTNSSRYYLLNNSLRLGAHKKSMVYNIVSKWMYGQQNDKLTNNDLNSTLDINLYKTLPHFYYWGLGNYANSYSLKIQSQLQAGFGAAYNIIDKPTLVINLSDGFIYDYSNLTLVDGNHQEYGTIRNSARIQIKWNVGTRLVFRGNCFYQPSLQYGNDYIIRSDMSLAVKLKKWISILSTFSYNTMSRTGAENLFITYGLVIENYY